MRLEAMSHGTRAAFEPRGWCVIGGELTPRRFDAPEGLRLARGERLERGLSREGSEAQRDDRVRILEARANEARNERHGGEEDDAGRARGRDEQREADGSRARANGPHTNRLEEAGVSIPQREHASLLAQRRLHHASDEAVDDDLGVELAPRDAILGHLAPTHTLELELACHRHGSEARREDVHAGLHPITRQSPRHAQPSPLVGARDGGDRRDAKRVPPHPRTRTEEASEHTERERRRRHHVGSPRSRPQRQLDQPRHVLSVHPRWNGRACKDGPVRMRRLSVAFVLAIAACDEPEVSIVSEPSSEELRPVAPEVADDVDPLLPRLSPGQLVLVAESDADFHLALESDLIVEASSFSVGWSDFHDRGRVDGTPTMDLHEHRSLEGHVDHVIVGSWPQSSIRFDVYCDDSNENGVECERLRALVAEPNRPVTLFLTYANGDILYLAGWSPEALRPTLDPATRERLSTLGADATERLERAPRPAVQASVDAEVARMTRSARDEYDAMRALQAMGPVAIPAIVRHMSDRRFLPSSTVLVEMPPDFFEAFGHFGVVRVVDILSMIAGSLTNGPTCHGLSTADEDHTGEAARLRCAQRWTRFVARGLDDGAFGHVWR